MLFKDRTMKVIVTKKFSWGFCPGPFIVLPKGYTETTYKHEYGHHLQYKKYGLLVYYLKVAFPSIIGWWIDKLFHKKWTWAKRYRWYYAQPWEAEADKLGGVNR